MGTGRFTLGRLASTLIAGLRLPHRARPLPAPWTRHSLLWCLLSLTTDGRHTLWSRSIANRIAFRDGCCRQDSWANMPRGPSWQREAARQPSLPADDSAHVDRCKRSCTYDGCKRGQVECCRKAVIVVHTPFRTTVLTASATPLDPNVASGSMLQSVRAAGVLEAPPEPSVHSRSGVDVPAGWSPCECQGDASGRHRCDRDGSRQREGRDRAHTSSGREVGECTPATTQWERSPS